MSCRLRHAVSLSSLFVSLGLMIPYFAAPAASMGQAPSTCHNLYPATITSFILTGPSGQVNALQNQNQTIVVPADSSYNVTFVLHTAAKNVYGNTSLGTIWYQSDYPTSRTDFV